MAWVQAVKLRQVGTGTFAGSLLNAQVVTQNPQWATVLILEIPGILIQALNGPEEPVAFQVDIHSAIGAS